MASEQDNARIKQGLMDDLAGAQTMAQQSSAGRGAPEPSDFAPRSLRIKNKAIAQEQMNRLNTTIDDAVNHYTQDAGFTDDVQAGQFSHNLRKKFDQYKLLMIRQAGQAAKEKTRVDTDEAGHKNMLKALAGMVSQGASLAMGQIGKSAAPKTVPQGVNAAGKGMASNDDWAGFTGANAAAAGQSGIQTSDDWANFAGKK